MNCLNKIGLKLWNTNVDYYLKSAVTLYKQGIFDYIELYIVPNNLDKIDIWKSTGIPFDIHAPHSAHKMNLANANFSDSNFALYCDVKKYADELNARYIVFHGGVDGTCNEIARQLTSFSDDRALIENKPYKPLKFVCAKEYMGAKPDDIKYIIKNSSCGFCLDIGHAICAANSFKFEPYSYIQDFVSLNPSKVHLSDMYVVAEEDMHLNFGLGDIDFKLLLGEILPKDIDITIETNKHSATDLNDFVQDVKFLRKVMESI